MLKQISYKFIAVFMLVLFLAASTGLNFYVHICSCSHRTFASIIEEHKCHTATTTSCCSASHNNEPNFSSSSCGCKSLQLSIKIDDTFNASNQQITEAKLFSFQIDRIQNQLVRISPTEQNSIPNIDLYNPDDSPPIKPVGRILIYFLHQSKSFDHLS